MNAKKKVACFVVMGMALMAMSAEAVDMTNAVPVQAKIPPPSETPAKIIVSGRTSTAVDIKIVKVGQEIPKTYAGTQIRNTPGFEFYVSEHFALKSSKDEAFSRMVLELSELSYPQWVAMVGAEPPDADTRLYLVYARDGKELCKAMNDDIGWDPGGFQGGFTTYANRSAYNLPGGGLMYHLRALVTHENLHMLNMVCNGTGGGEFMSYTGEQQVYDPVKKQLTVFCFDKAPINNYTRDGLSELRKEFVPMQEAVKKFWYGGGGAASVYHFFFFSDPDRFLKWQIWRDEFFYANRVSAESNPAIMESIFGPLDKLNVEWEAWVKQRRATFHHVDWGWEQEGNTLMAYGFPWDSKYWSQMDIAYAPNEKVLHDPLRMDYPAEPMPEIVGPVQRGVAEPSVGYVADLSGGGWVGFGLGVSNRCMCQVVIMDGRLVVEGKDMPVPRKEFPLTDEVKVAGKQDGNRYGVTIRIAAGALDVTVRSGPAPAIKSMSVSVPLDAAVRERLVSGIMSIVAKDGRPKITPYIDDARRMPPDLMKPAPANRWRFEGLDELETLYRADWRLKELSPPSLKKLKQSMVASVDKEPDVQKAAMELYRKSISNVLQDVQKVPDAAKASLAVSEILGVSFQLEVDRDRSSNDQVMVNAIVRSIGQNDAKGTVALMAKPAGSPDTVPEGKPVQVTAGKAEKITFSFKLPASQGLAKITAKAALTCNGIMLTLEDSKTLRPSIPCWWTIGPFDNKGGGTVDTLQPIETEKIDLEKKYPGKGMEIAWRKSERSASIKPTDEFVLDFAKMYGGENVSAYAVTWFTSPNEQDAVLAIGSDDGVVVWLNGRVHTNLVLRGYASKQDRVPIHLKAGRNELRVKIIQGNGGWAMGAHLLDKDGNPLSDIVYIP